MPRHAIPSEFSNWYWIWDKWHLWLKENQIAPTAACISHALSCSDISRIVVGVDTLAQIKEVVRFAKCSSTPSFPDIKCDDDELINPANWSIKSK